MPDPVFQGPHLSGLGGRQHISTEDNRGLAEFKQRHPFSPIARLDEALRHIHTIEPKTVTDEIRLMADSIAPRRPTTLLGTRPRS